MRKVMVIKMMANIRQLSCLLACLLIPYLVIPEVYAEKDLVATQSLRNGKTSRVAHGIPADVKGFQRRVFNKPLGKQSRAVIVDVGAP